MQKQRGPAMASLITSIASPHKAQTLSVLPLDIWIKPSSWGREKLPFCFAFFGIVLLSILILRAEF